MRGKQSRFSLSLVPADNPVVIVQEMLPEIGCVAMVEGTTATPGCHHQPERPILLHVLPRRHAVALRHSCHLVGVSLSQLAEIGRLGYVRGVVLWIAVTSHNVHILIARVPVVVAHK